TCKASATRKRWRSCPPPSGKPGSNSGAMSRRCSRTPARRRLEAADGYPCAPAWIWVGNQLGQFNLGRLQHELILPFRRRRQLDVLDTPAAMLERPPKRRLPRHVPRQPNGRRIETRQHLDGFLLVLGHHGFQDEMFLQGVLGFLVDVAHRGANLLVGV